MLTAFHLVWCALLWLLARPNRMGLRRTALVAILFGALPRLMIGIARIPGAWRNDQWGFADLIAFESLTILWLVYLRAACLWPAELGPQTAFPMMVFAAVECLGAIMAGAAVAGSLVQGTLSHVWWRAAIALIYGVAQVRYLRDSARMSIQPEPHWNRL
ncbi:MAG: hypothetical protein WDO18_15305 [Acidobacteriota bacterium]